MRPPVAIILIARAPLARDGVEDRLHTAVCNGEVILTAAQQAIAANWVTAEAVLGVKPRPS